MLPRILVLIDDINFTGVKAVTQVQQADFSSLSCILYLKPGFHFVKELQVSKGKSVKYF